MMFCARVAARDGSRAQGNGRQQWRPFVFWGMYSLMSTMIAELYDALREAGASDEKAKAAAIALADYRNRFDRIDFDLGAVKAELPIIKSDVATLKTDLAVVKAELAMVKWIVSGVGFGVLLLVLRSFWPG